MKIRYPVLTRLSALIFGATKKYTDNGDQLGWWRHIDHRLTFFYICRSVSDLVFLRKTAHHWCFLLLPTDYAKHAVMRVHPCNVIVKWTFAICEAKGVRGAFSLLIHDRNLQCSPISLSPEMQQGSPHRLTYFCLRNVVRLSSQS